MPRKPKPVGPPGTVWFGGHVERVTICFRIMGETLDPDEITQQLGTTPTDSRRKGDEIVRNGRKTDRISRIGSWILRYEPQPEMTVDEAITDFLEKLTSDDATWKSFTNRFDVDLICDVAVYGANQGFEIPATVLLQLAQRGIKLGVDIFTYPDDEQTSGLEKHFPEDLTL
jgi:hypothetical protein